MIKRNFPEINKDFNILYKAYAKRTWKLCSSMESGNGKGY